MLRTERFSPEQIAGKLRRMELPSLKDAYVCRETIYNAIYALPVGELRKELIICLRQGKKTRRPRSGGVDRRGQIPDLVSIYLRPPEVEDRLMPGHWEGDLIKGKGNASAVGTLVERSSGYQILVKMYDATATSAVEGFSAALNRMPLAVRKTLTYDRGREMMRHAEITQKTGVGIYFCDPHSPWQRGSNENTNGLIRQYLPKGTDLSVYSQAQLDRIALSLNIRPRKRFDFKCPIEVMSELMTKHHPPPPYSSNPVALRVCKRRDYQATGFERIKEAVMFHYPVNVHFENGHYWSSCLDIPEAHSAGDTLDELLANAPEGIALALSIYVEQGRAIPLASPLKEGQRLIYLPALVCAKIALWNALCKKGWHVADLARLLEVSHPVARRLVDFAHHSKIGLVEKALHQLGRRLEVVDTVDDGLTAAMAC